MAAAPLVLLLALCIFVLARPTRGDGVPPPMSARRKLEPDRVAVSVSAAAAEAWYTGSRTGITAAYLEACARALASPPHSLSYYKRDPSIVFVADPVSPICAKKCIRLLSKFASPGLLRRALAPGGPMDALDRVGHPRTYDFGGAFGSRHPLSVRSLWHVADMLRHFSRPGEKHMEGWRVAEIGAGAICGVSRLLLDLTRVATYDVFEIPAVGEVCRQATHGGQDAHGRLHFYPAAAGGIGGGLAAGPGEEPYDLVLSTFSLSELDLSTQRLYGVRLLARAKRLYIATNAPRGGNMFGEGADRRAFVPARELSSSAELPLAGFERGPFLRRLLRSSHPNLETWPGYLPGANEVWVSGPRVGERARH